MKLYIKSTDFSIELQILVWYQKILITHLMDKISLFFPRTTLAYNEY